MADSTLAFNILARDLGASNAFEKVARSADKTSASLSKTVKVSDEAAQASERLTKAHDSENDALGKVRTAEAKLAEVRGNSNSKTSQIVRAEEALSKARRDSARASNVAQKAAQDLGKVLDDEGKKAGKGFGTSLKNWFTGDGKNVFKQVGENAGNGILGGITGALKTPVIGPVVAGVLAGAVATAAPAVGAIAASGIVAGFGAGIATLGIVFAAKSQAVKSAWTKTLADMGAQMQVLSKPFESTLIEMAAIAKRTFAAFAPVLGEAFKRMAPVLTTFGDQLGRAFEKLKPAILPLTDAFNAVIKALGPAVQDAIGKVSDGLVKLASSVQRSPDALADLVRGMGDLVKTTLDLITMLNDANQKFKDLTGISAVTAVMAGLNGVLQGTKLALQGITAPLGLVNDSVNALSHGTDVSGKSMSDAANKTVLLAQGLQKTQTATTGVAVASNAANTAARALAAQFDRQWQATQQANAALTRQSGLLLTLSGSQIAYQQAVDDATAAVKANGKTLDITTQKGRDNKTALDQVAASANAQTIAMRNAGDGNVSAAKHGEQARAAFVKLATQMGLSVPQAKAMAKSMIDIPNVSRTAKLKADKADLDAKLAKAKTQLADPKLTATKKAKLEAEIAALQAAIAKAKAAIAGVQGKTVYIDAIVRQRGTIKAADPRLGVPGRAAGGPVTKGMPYIVGEHRPELFVPKQDGTIIPRVPRSSQGAAFGGGSTTINVYVTGALDSRDAADKIVGQLRKFVRVSGGGNVQVALGQ